MSDRVLHNRYRLGPQLGKGGMGTVYRAQDLRDGGRTCAVKMLRSELTHDVRVRRRFVDEAKSLLRLDHPNIVRVAPAASDCRKAATGARRPPGRHSRPWRSCRAAAR